MHLRSNMHPACIVRVDKLTGLQYYSCMRHYNRLQAPIACECGFKLKCGSGLAKHRKSLLHCSAGGLRALLDSNLNFSMIGRRLGVSRERVRQLASNLGYKPGRERRAQCTLARIAEELIETPVITALQHSCPYPVELIRRPSARGDLWFYTTEVRILGKRCAIYRARFMSIDKVRFHYSRGFSGLCDFCLVLIPDGRWIVCPSVKSVSTCFKLGERSLPGNPGAFHGWNERIGAWQILAS